MATEPKPFVLFYAILATLCVMGACYFGGGPTRAERGVAYLLGLASLVAGGLALAQTRKSAEGPSCAPTCAQSQEEVTPFARRILSMCGEHGEVAQRLVASIMKGEDVDITAEWETRAAEVSPGEGWFRLCEEDASAVWMSPTCYVLNGEIISAEAYRQCQTVLAAFQALGEKAAEDEKRAAVERACLAPFAAGGAEQFGGVQEWPTVDEIATHQARGGSVERLHKRQCAGPGDVQRGW